MQDDDEWEPWPSGYVGLSRHDLNRFFRDGLPIDIAAQCYAEQVRQVLESGNNKNTGSDANSKETGSDANVTNKGSSAGSDANITKNTGSDANNKNTCSDANNNKDKGSDAKAMGAKASKAELEALIE